MWHEQHKECNRICIIKSQNLSCFDNASDSDVRAAFKFDINLPISTYYFGKCKSCFNITQINITCLLNKTRMEYESHSIQNKEITTAKIIYELHSTQNEEITTSKMIHESQSTQNLEITTVEMMSEPHSTQNGEITSTKIISRSSGKIFRLFVFIFVLFHK